MRRMAIFAALTAVAALAVAWGPAAPAEAGAEARLETGPERPRDPWVFRCVLDEQARMVVIALHEHLWVAYDATDCTLYKAWDGDVKFTGAVYDYVHGPQPEVRGQALLDHDAEARWTVRAGNTLKPVTATWRGYRFVGDRVYLQYELPGANGTPIRISESPEATIEEDGTYVLTRTFETSNVPDGWILAVSLSTNQDPDLHLTYAIGDSAVPVNGGNRAGGGPDHQGLTFPLASNGTNAISARISKAQGGAR